MLYGLVITIHVIVSLVLRAVILLQAGRGGGLSESFGGSQTQTVRGGSARPALSGGRGDEGLLYHSWRPQKMTFYCRGKRQASPAGCPGQNAERRDP